MVQKRLSSLAFVRENRQLLIGIVLVIVIPSLVVFNSYIFFKRFTHTLDIELHDRSSIIGKITGTLIQENFDDPAKLQAILTEITDDNDEILFLEIDRLDGAEFVVWASTDEENIGKIDTDPATSIAWQNNRGVAFRGPNANGSEQFWTIHHPIKEGAEQAVLKMHLSTELIESTARNVLWQSFILLIGVLFVIMMLLILNSRLFQYAVLYRKLKELDQAKDDFISVASHELRTPITAIHGYFTMLAEGSYGKISQKTKESVEFMEGNVNRLQLLVEDLLNVSRIQQGKMKMEFKNVNVKEIIEEIIRTLEPNAVEKKLTLKKELKEDIMVYADSDRLKQVLINIIGNAIKYTEKGSVTTILGVEKEVATITVKDTGIGMSPSEQERLFEKFYRAQNDKTREITGTGLGLWITKAIIELMGGKISVNSIQGTGTQVSFTIPLAKNEEKEEKK